jgi:hypothetical protein
VLRRLRCDGIALVKIDDLLGETETWGLAAERARDFIQSDEVKRQTAKYIDDPSSSGKQYIVRQWPERPTLSVGDPWLALGLAPCLLDTVNSYLGLWSKLNYVDLWYTIPCAKPREAVASQRWHRDPEDERMVKVFLYLSDVVAEAGPLEYVRSSARGRYESLWPNPNLGTASYPPAEELERRVATEDRVLATSPAGTLVFCDTHGFHRGGLATTRPRVMATWAYLTPASIFARRFDIASSDHDSLSEPAAFALR